MRRSSSSRSSSTPRPSPSSSGLFPSAPRGGRHELGQNFLAHARTIARIVALVADTRGSILEIGAGDGALTVALARLGRPLTAIDVDDSRVERLRRALPDVRVETADVLRHALDAPVIVGNIPFHLTTPILRRLLARPAWDRAVLLTQWEVARKRAGVGGSTMMTAQAGAWFEFALHDRVPARAFRPTPSVDGGLLTIARRAVPLVPPSRRASYERFVRDVFTARGSGVAGAFAAVTGRRPAAARAVLAAQGIRVDALARDLRAEHWAALWHVRRDGR
jgi:23S rRNA (adenine-N6)-dimethyltransferase